MTPETVEQTFREKVGAAIRIAPEGQHRYRVFTPFLLDDGDHLSIVLRRGDSGWALSDEGHTFMHLTYDIDEKDLNRGARQKVISNALDFYAVQEREGELVLPVEDEDFGDALYSFVQALMRITDVTYLTRERVRSTFIEDFRALIEAAVPEERRAFDWSHPEYDASGKYVVDCRVNNLIKPLFLFALPTDDRVRDATIALHQFEKWNIPHFALGVFEDQETVNRKVLARFSDVCDKQFASLNRERISQYIQEWLL